MKQRIEELETIARTMIGDGKTPNVFFVSLFDGKHNGLIMVTTQFEAAYSCWKELPRTVQTTLEARNWGVVCSTEPEEDGSKILRTYDGSASFRKDVRKVKKKPIRVISAYDASAPFRKVKRKP